MFGGWDLHAMRHGGLGGLFFQAVYDRFMPSKSANLRDPYKIRFSICFEKSKIVVNPMV